MALYGGDGFFARGRGAGRAGRDFVTSPEVGSLFGACVGRALDGWWRALGEPDPFVVVEAGAGAGRLASDVLRSAPACAAALRYVLVERSEVLRDAQRARLPIEPPDAALGPFARGEDDDEIAAAAGTGPVVTSIEDLPAAAFDGVVLANELLDNLPFGIAEWDGSRWNEIRVGLGGPDGAGELVEVPVPALAADAAALLRLAGDRAVDPGTRVPIPRGIERWLDACGRALRRGAVVLVDYAVPLDELVARGHGWLRTYRAHSRAGSPLVDPGSCDITADIVLEQLEVAARAAGLAVAGVRSQAEWLDELGIEALVEEGRRAWDAGAHRGDLAAIAGRSRVHEAAALTDPAGLGAHTVVTLTPAPR